MAWSFTKINSIADFVAAIYGKGLNLIKTDSTTDPLTSIYGIGPKFYKIKLCHNPQLRTGSVAHLITDISSKDLKVY